MSEVIETSVGPMTAEGVVDYLNYCNYRANRERMSAADLAKLWPESGAAMEQRYQRELNNYAEAGIRKDQRDRIEGRDDGGKEFLDGLRRSGL